MKRRVSAAITTGDTLVGKYRVESVLGEGGMGVVLAARHLDLGCLVAIKVIRGQLGADEPLVRRLMFEARAAARIQSEHVCRVLDVSRLEDGSPFIVMEHLEGETLGATLARVGVLTEQLAADYVLQACEPLAEAHAAGIVHRDLKPENLFLARRPDASYLIKVLDFGVSKATSASALRAHAQVTRADTAIGSPYYMAPEQMAARADLDQRADIWALGAILYQLTTGSMPFDGGSLPEVCAAVLRADPVPPRARRADLSERFEHCIMRCLQSDRERRYASVAELARDLQPCASGAARVLADRISRILRDVPQGPAVRTESGQDVPDEAAHADGVSGSRSPEQTRLATSASHQRPSAGPPGPTGADGLSRTGVVSRPPRGRTARRIGYAIIALGIVAGIGTAAVVLSRGPVPAAATGVPRHLPGAVPTARQAQPAGSEAVHVVPPAGTAPTAFALPSEPHRDEAGRLPAVSRAPATANRSPVSPGASMSSAARTTPRTPRTAQAVSRDPTSENRRNAQDAWNPDNFGGRR